MLTTNVATIQDNSTHGEDSFLTRDLGKNTFLDAVMDGVTGHGGGEASSSIKVALAEATINSIEDIAEILEQINDEFYQVGGGKFLLSTISATLFKDGQLFVVGAGDSPVFLIGTDSIEQLSGRVGGFLHVGVAKAIGASEEMATLTRNEARIEPGARLVLATDGVSDNIHVDELADIVRRVDSPEEAGKQIEAIVANRLELGRVPEQLGVRSRHDDRTAIFRFFGSDT
jgi:serine/threonine protein phosphatase PrpC